MGYQEAAGAADSLSEAGPVTRAGKRRKLHRQKEMCLASLWSCPPQDVFDVLCARFCPRNIVAMQLVCKYWRDAVRRSMKCFSARRPDVDLGLITHVYPNITDLNLSIIDGLTLAQLAPLSNLTSLSSLNLPAVEGGGAASIGLTRLSNLTQFEAHYSTGMRHELSQLSQLTQLRVLTLHWCCPAASLRALKSLESLALPCAYLEEGDVRALSLATGLSQLRFKVNSRGLGVALSAVSALPSLKRLELSVSSNSSTPSPWAPCVPPTGLTWLSLELFDTLFRYGLQALEGLPGLACLRLSLHWTQSPPCTAELPSPPELTSLHLSSGSHNSTHGVVLLRPMPKLQSLRLTLHHASCASSLSALLESNQLCKLRLIDCHAIHDDTIATLVQLTRVTKLKMEHLQNVSPAGLGKLSSLTNLQQLLLARCRLSDSVLSSLARLSNLRRLSLSSPLPPHPSRLQLQLQHQQHFSSLALLTSLQQLSMHRLEPLPEQVLLRALPRLAALRELLLEQQEGASDEVLCALTELRLLSSLSARFCRNVTSRSRTAMLQAFGACIALDYEGCRVPDPLRPLQQPSNSTQAVVMGRPPAGTCTGRSARSDGSR